jgi:hypothetical protein
MTESKPDFWDWLDLSGPGGTPLKLRPNAPDEIKKSFKQWKKKKKKYDKQWAEEDKKRSGKPNKEIQALLDLWSDKAT